MEKIKLIIFPGNFLPHTGGLESHVDNFVKYLSKNYSDYEITIFTPNTEKANDIDFIHNNVKVIRYPAFFIVNNFPLAKFWKLQFWKIYIKLYKENYDIVMTRTMFFFNTSLGTFFSKIRLNKLKLIHVEHGSDYSKLDSKLISFVNKAYMHLFGKLTLSLSDRIICVSEAGKNFLRNNFNVRKEINVIYRGVDLEYFKIIDKSNYFEKYQNKNNIAFVGRLIDGKGVQDIIEVMNDLNSNIILHVIGDGEYKSKLIELVNVYKLQDRVHFLGKLKHSEVISILKNNPLFINPSYTEGLPTSVLDALFAGCPIIASNVGGTYEILKDKWNLSNYYQIYEAKDLIKLKEKILNYFDNDEIKLNVDLDMKQFDWTEHASKYNEKMYKLINEL